MKFFKLASLCAAFILCSGAVFAQGITGSAHDFTSAAWNSSGEICLPCHTPHNAKVMDEVPLWNHMTTTATYTMYSNTNSSTFDATPGTEPDGNSKACLSCHDGTVALENFGDVTTGTTMMTGTRLLSTDLSNDHPISFVFDAALATLDGELHDPTTQTTAKGGTIDNDMLFAQKMQCASCHDPHNTDGFDHMMRFDNAASALCLTCHNK